MKSVIVQGATVAKAIDEALTKAGMPQEFFIKVLEEAQPGFLGFGSKKAKIALFFKKDDGRRDSSMLSRGTYKDLFDNPQLQAQPAAPEKQDKIEKKETPAQQQLQRKVEVQPRKEQAPVQQQQPRKAEAPQRKIEAPAQPQQQRKVETAPVRDMQPLKVEATSIQQPQQKKPIVPQQQRPQLQQRPLKSLQPQQPAQDKPQVISVAMDKQPVVTQSKAVEPVVQNNNAQVESENRRPRRRRHYGYRSKAPVQWGKSQDEQPDQSNNDERHDSEPS